MSKRIKYIGVSVVIVAVLLVVAMGFVGGPGVDGQQGDSAVLWRSNSVIGLPTQDIAVLWRSNSVVGLPSQDVAVLWRSNSVGPGFGVPVLWPRASADPAQDVAVLWRSNSVFVPWGGLV